MRKRPAKLAVTLGALALVLGALGGAAAASSIFVEIGDLKATFGAAIKPKALPRSGRAPIAAVLSSRIESKDGSHIPPIRQATINIDRSIAIDSRGVAICSAAQLENQSTESAEAACSAALVGTGSATIEIALPGAAPIRAESRLLAFNGGTVGTTTTVLLHAYLTSPTPEALVVPIVLTKIARGGYGLSAFAAIPRIASGSGSLADFELAFRRQVTTTAGARHGYLVGRCSDGNFVFAPKVEFEGGNSADGLLAFGCDRTGKRPSGK